MSSGRRLLELAWQLSNKFYGFVLTTNKAISWWALGMYAGLGNNHEMFRSIAEGWELLVIGAT